MAETGSFSAGYEAAYKDMYRIIQDEDHVKGCGKCRPCGVIKEITETLLETLAYKMTREEFFGLALALGRASPPKGNASGYFSVKWEEAGDVLPPLHDTWE